MKRDFKKREILRKKKKTGSQKKFMRLVKEKKNQNWFVDEAAFSTSIWVSSRRLQIRIQIDFDTAASYLKQNRFDGLNTSFKLQEEVYIELDKR